jgi:hypothetical protein
VPSPAGAGTSGSAPALLLSALLPRGVRDRLRTEIGPEVPLHGAASEAFAGVLAVEQAAVSVSTGAAGSSTSLSVQLRCETPDACHEVEKLLWRKRLAFSRDFEARLIGLGPLLDSLTIEVEGTTLSARAALPTDDLARLIRRLAGPARPRIHALPSGSPAPATPTAPPPGVLTPPEAGTPLDAAGPSDGGR